MGIEHSRCELRKLDIILLIVEFGTVGFLLPRDGWTQSPHSQLQIKILKIK
jgi:hypothetical protein